LVHLVPFSENDLSSYLEFAIPDYASDKVKAGNWTEDESLERSRNVYAELLPDGVNTKDHYLFRVVADETNEKVGMIWLAVLTEANRTSGFIYDILIDEHLRGKGYGKHAMLAIEEKARSLGLRSIGLHAFGYNEIAIGLYKKIGYKTTNVIMNKDLD